MDDLITEFIAETTESLSMLDQELVKLEQNPSDEAILGNIFRIVHTIKGTCGFLGLPRLESVAHASENVLGKIRDKQQEATPQAISLVLESLDRIKELIDYLSSNGAEPEGQDDDLKKRLNHLADTGQILGAGGAASPVAPAPVADAPADFSKFFKGDDDLNALLAEQGASSAPVIALVTPTPAEPEKAPVAAAVPAPAAAKAADKPAAGGAAADANQSIRVNLDVLENLMQMVSELVLTRNQLMQIVRTKEDRDFLAPLQHLSHITSELQEGVMKTRMQPIGNAWQKFPRLIRDLSMELGKKIDLKMLGAETELDRQLLEMIKDPLTHMVRNSCDHGLEVPADRKAAGKSEMGSVTLSAYHEGGHIIIDIIDDGRGINLDRVKQKIIQNGLASEAEVAGMSDQQIMRHIFHAGFSTAEKVTSVSGRGVGMDVVRTNIEKIGGTVELDSVYGKGSTFSIKIPLTLAIVSVLIVESRGDKFAIPQINVTELVRVAEDSEYKIETINRAPVLRLREKLLPLIVLGDVLGLETKGDAWSSHEAFIAVCRVGGADFGVIVDRVYDTEEIVVKPVAEIIKSLSIYSGNTILGDGSVIMILDPNGLSKTLGENEMAAHQEEEVTNAVDAGVKMVSFLLFSAGDGAPKAVPLELVSRLEEIEVSTIEYSGDEPVVQYRGELMQLMRLDDSYAIPSEGMVQVIVFTYDKRTVGLVVGEILDIVSSAFDVKLSSHEKLFLGSMVIGGKTTDVVDVAQLLSIVVEGEPSDKETAGHQKANEYNILLVEDSPFFRNLTVPFLAAAGYKITAVESGQDALKAIGPDSHKFDLIVTDIEMPGMNGFEFTQACRAIPGMKATPIIAYTASLSNEVMRKGLEIGMQDCILKTDRPKLLQAVSHYLQQQEMAA
jgi:two-component system, chemotaxis family, sensor kinase CheA